MKVTTEENAENFVEFILRRLEVETRYKCTHFQQESNANRLISVRRHEDSQEYRCNRASLLSNSFSKNTKFANL